MLLPHGLHILAAQLTVLALALHLGPVLFPQYLELLFLGV